MSDMKLSVSERSKDANGPVFRKPYQSPNLSSYGKILENTLGPSAGTGESTNPAIFMGAVVVMMMM